jgi:hypothetical protein
MRRDLERRLRLVEIAGARTGGIHIWIDQGDGAVRDLQGKEMRREEAEALASVSGSLALVISEADAQL